VPAYSLDEMESMSEQLRQAQQKNKLYEMILVNIEKSSNSIVTQIAGAYPRSTREEKSQGVI
jgi:hypothetical protein